MLQVNKPTTTPVKQLGRFFLNNDKKIIEVRAVILGDFVVIFFFILSHKKNVIWRKFILN